MVRVDTDRQGHPDRSKQGPRRFRPEQCAKHRDVTAAIGRVSLGSGEVNTLGTPTGNISLVLAKVAAELKVRGLVSMNSRLTIVLDAAGEDVEFTVVESEIVLANLSGAATDAQYPNAVLRDGTRAMTGKLDGGSNQIINVADPANAQDVATKAWVEANFQTL